VESVRRRLKAARLDIDDVDLSGNRISIFHIAIASGEPVTLPPPTKAALLVWLEACEPERVELVR